jgi:hypothetical protein
MRQQYQRERNTAPRFGKRRGTITFAATNTPMKKLLLVLSLMPLCAVAQNFHFAGRLGFAGYNGDLKDKLLSQHHILGSIGAKYDLSEHFTARGFFTMTKLRADDKKGNAGMQQRNLNFQTKLWEIELSAQYNLFSMNDKWWTPYIYAGIGIYHFNPYTMSPAKRTVFLRPLSTEGQGFVQGVSPYAKTQFCLPIGFGGTYALSEDLRVGLEFGYRKLFTDYLDDVSRDYVDEATLRTARGQLAVDYAFRGDEKNGASYPPAGAIRGNPEHNDGYYYIAATFSIRYFFDKYKQIVGLPSSGRSKRVGCPATRGY